QAEQRLHERGVLVVVAEAALDGAAGEALGRVAVGRVLEELAVPGPIELGGFEVIAFVARVALGPAAEEQRRQHDGEDDAGPAAIGPRQDADHWRASAWKPRLRQAGS